MLAERRRTPPFLKFGAGKLRALPRASDAFLACVLWRRRWGLCSRRQRELSCAPLHGARLLALAGRPRASFPHCQFLYWLFARSLVRLFRSSPFSRSFLCSAALHASVVVETRAMSLDEGDQERQAKAIRCSYARRRGARDTLFARAFPLPRTILWAAPHLGILLFLFLHAAVSYDGSGTQVRRSHERPNSSSSSSCLQRACVDGTGLSELTYCCPHCRPNHWWVVCARALPRVTQCNGWRSLSGFRGKHTGWEPFYALLRRGRAALVDACCSFGVLRNGRPWRP